MSSRGACRRLKLAKTAVEGVVFGQVVKRGLGFCKVRMLGHQRQHFARRIARVHQQSCLGHRKRPLACAASKVEDVRLLWHGSDEIVDIGRVVPANVAS